MPFKNSYSMNGNKGGFYMGLFDRIKKAFSGEQNEEPEKQEEVVDPIFKRVWL